MQRLIRLTMFMVARLGLRSAGRLLDGEEWSEFPSNKGLNTCVNGHIDYSASERRA